MKLVTLFLLSYSLFGATNLATVIGSDGTKCTLNKQVGSTIYLIINCHSADSLDLMPASIKNTTIVSGAHWFNLNTVMIFVGTNPTSSPYDFGTLGIAPPNGATFQVVGDANSNNLVSGITVWP